MFDIVPGKTQFKCANDTLLVIRRTRGIDKWLASYSNRSANYMPVVFSGSYIQKYRTVDRDDQTRETS